VVLGTLAAHVGAAVNVGETYVVLGWCIQSEGRKHHAASAITNASGDLIATATSVWFTVRA
jgi:hypothetical protein